MASVTSVEPAIDELPALVPYVVMSLLLNINKKNMTQPT